MKRLVSISISLLLAVSGFAETVFVFSSHPTSITDKDLTTEFDQFSESTGGYSDGYFQDGRTTQTCSDGHPLIAAEPEGTRFLGWFSKEGGWAWNDDVTVESADNLISDSLSLTWPEIRDKAGECNQAKLVVAKYHSLYKIEGAALPFDAVEKITGTNIYEEGDLVTLTATPKSGYSFEKWTKGDFRSTANQLEFTATNGCAGTYTANFTGNVYKVEFAKGIGEGGDDEVMATFGLTMPQLEALPQRFGYDFGGYFDKEEGKGNQYYAADGTSLRNWDKARESTLYAYWRPQMAQLRLRFDKGEIESIGYRTGQGDWIVVSADTDIDVQVGIKVWAYGVPKDGYELVADDFENPWSRTMQPQGWTFSPETKKAKVYHAVTFTDPSGTFEDMSVKVEEGGTAVAPTDWARRGYSLSWNKSLGPITAETEIAAVWTAHPYAIVFAANGGTGQMDDLETTYGVEVELPPNAFAKGILTFQHWTTTVDGVSCTFADGAVVSNLTDVAQGTNVLFAVWGEDYLVAFDANGATSGTMDQQRFFRGIRQPLLSNAYGRTGHTFRGWAANLEKAIRETIDYTNGQEVVNLAPVGTTNTLYAVWSTNSFTVVFDANGGMGTMSDQTFSYGHAQSLSKCAFTRPVPWEFKGWLDSETGRTFADGESVADLRAEDGARVVLKAQWQMEIGELSEAMDCTNLKWDYGNYKGGALGWTVCPDKGYESESCALHSAASGTATMHARISSPGTLAFRWQPTDGESLIVYIRVYKADGTEKTGKYECPMGVDGSWENQFELTVLPQDFEIDPGDVVVIEIDSLNFGSACETYIDQMTWTPEGGGEPTQGDPVAASLAGVNGNVFSLTIPTTSGTDYGVWTNADLTVPAAEWGLMETKKADGTTLDFSLEMLPGVPQLFFRAYEAK